MPIGFPPLTPAVHPGLAANTTFATGNLLGRLLTPVASDVLLTRRGRARPWMLLGIALTMGLAHLALLWAGSGTLGGGEQHALLVGASGAAGVAFGATWPMLVILASELFGRTHLVLNYLFFDGGCGSVGNLVIANLLSTIVYSRAMHGHAGASGQCIGPACFGPTHAVEAFLCALSVCAAAVLALRATPLYRQRA